MKVLLLTQFFQPEPMFKGLPLARALRERGHEVSVLTGFPNYPGGRLYPGYERQRFRRDVVGDVVVYRVPLFPSHDRSGLKRALNYLSFGAASALRSVFLSSKPDVVWVYNLVTLAPAWTVLRHLHGSAVVLEVQDLWPESVTNSGMLRLPPWAARTLTAGCDAAYRSADGLIAQSAGFRSRLVARGVDPARIRVIPNWADESLPEPTLADRAIARQRAGMDVKFTVLFAGTMGTVQALDCVIGAAEILEHRRPEVQFVLVGGGVDVERLKRKAAGRGNVRFLPKCTPGEAQAMTLEADALLVHLKADPLFEVTIPSKTQAYLRSGRPILVGVRGDAADMVDAAGAGLGFEPESAESLAARVSELASLGRDAIDRMGANGKRYYEKHLSAGIGVSSLESVLQAAISRRGGGC